MKKRFIPIGIIILLMIMAYISGITQYFSLEEIKNQLDSIKNIVETNWIISPLLFIILYITATALSLPISIYLTLIGGFLFEQPYSTIFVVTGATFGASLLYLAAQTAFGDFLKKKLGPNLKKMERGFQENAASYLLFLRFIPVFPFWMVNLAPAFVGVPFWTFFWTTAVGIIPGAFAYTQVGTGLGRILDSGDEISLHNLLNTDIKIGLVALAIIALLPALYNLWKRKK